jgi:hypothetical protein
MSLVAREERASSVYWSNRSVGSGTTIGEASVSGTGANQSFISGASAPCGIAVATTPAVKKPKKQH